MSKMAAPPATARQEQPGAPVNLQAGHALGFHIVIPAADGTVLLEMTERDGYLVVEGDPSRWEEGAARFVHVMMQWAGLAGIQWKEDAARVATQ